MRASGCAGAGWIAISLFLKNLDPPFNALLDGQLGVLEVVTQHRFNQGRRVRPQAEQTQIRQQALPVQLFGLTNVFAPQTDQRKQLR